MAEIHHLEKSTWRHFFLPRVVRFWLISETGAEWHVDCAALRWCGRNQNQNVEFQYSGRLGEFNCMSSQSHLPHCRCKNSIRHIENRFSPYCILFLFFLKCSLGFDEQRLSYRLRYTCCLWLTVYTNTRANCKGRDVCRTFTHTC